MTQGITSPDYVGIGFEKIDRDLRFLIECLGEVLRELGNEELAAQLPWFGPPTGASGAGDFPPQLGLVYSIAFQLLNMVEENAAASMRVLHFQEIHLRRRWRALHRAGDDATAERMLPELLLSINAIASGLRTTG